MDIVGILKMGQKYAAYNVDDSIVGFYDSNDSPVPDGANVIPVSDETWLALLAAQSIGKRLVVNSTGNPVALDPLPPTQKQIAAAKRVNRDSALGKTDWLVARHQEEELLDKGTTLTADQFAALLNYRQALRECSDMPNWPDITLPTPPPFLSNQEDAIKQTAREAPRMQKNP
ncbi:phage tail assembly chaperone [Burkholderia plantarii]|uniref:phage tail assembly chaperone n=1 Tax=Burkholderia plantarii TaxID=41899 RepID=UPI001C0B0B68|nr:phage tail assembly chaperone [Burkholderia plantarii]